VDVFLGNTEAKKVLCIVPINTIQNWLAEFNYWLPAKVSQRLPQLTNFYLEPRR
jgi:RAD54-like protein 2